MMFIVKKIDSIHLGFVMKNPRRKNKSAVKDLESENQKIIDEFADLLLMEASHSSGQAEDPFEVYMDRIKSHIYADPLRFKERFSKGVHLLQQEMGIGK